MAYRREVPFSSHPITFETLHSKASVIIERQQISASLTMDLTERNSQAVSNEGSAIPMGLEDPTDIEKVRKEEELQSKENPTLRLDKHGLQLVPQPTAFKDDPLVSWCKPVSDCEFLLLICLRTGLLRSNSWWLSKSAG
jgi:hypothetical protein